MRPYNAVNIQIERSTARRKTMTNTEANGPTDFPISRRVTHDFHSNEIYQRRCPRRGSRRIGPDGRRNGTAARAKRDALRIRRFLPKRPLFRLHQSTRTFLNVSRPDVIWPVRFYRKIMNTKCRSSSEPDFHLSTVIKVLFFYERL
ncbi:hypothetical protein EVAR_22934_1 [Eumeta japonica]|uniref:Uncharacterized protein n=1 Tax=Eumeta variegata TaxID=151549 RepID=A0A4C1UVL7_EUMVA|nr:hypothetical protein EVAR_22934_1 [Eumeta japonica]